MQMADGLGTRGMKLHLSSEELLVEQCKAQRFTASSKLGSSGRFMNFGIRQTCVAVLVLAYHSQAVWPWARPFSEPQFSRS